MHHFQMQNQRWIPIINPIQSLYTILFIQCRNPFANILLKMFAFKYVIKAYTFQKIDHVKLVSFFKKLTKFSNKTHLKFDGRKNSMALNIAWKAGVQLSDRVCSTCVRPWVQTPTSQKEEKKKGREKGWEEDKGERKEGKVGEFPKKYTFSG